MPALRRAPAVRDEIARVDRARDDLALGPTARAPVDPCASVVGLRVVPDFVQRLGVQIADGLAVELAHGHRPVRQEADVAPDGDAARVRRGMRLVAKACEEPAQVILLADAARAARELARD